VNKQRLEIPLPVSCTVADLSHDASGAVSTSMWKVGRTGNVTALLGDERCVDGGAR